MRSESERDLLRGGALALCAAFAIACAGFSRGEPTGSAGAGADADASVAGSGGGDASFAGGIHELLVRDCGGCHSTSGNAASSNWVLTDNAGADLAATLPFVDEASPARSRLLTKASGTGHGGGRVHAVESPEYATVLHWIREGAPP
jgi:hypothetical protein